MKTIGLLGGMSWESTIEYYKIVNTIVKEKLGGLHSAKCVLYSVDFQEVADLQKSGDWDAAAGILSTGAKALQSAGADFILICTNTMHKVIDTVQAQVSIPLIHIADITADALKKAGIKSVTLLGTKYTMEQDFYKVILHKNNIEVLIPDEAERVFINDVIFKELCVGKVEAKSKAEFLRIIDRLSKMGSKAVVLGCTEIGMLINQSDTAVQIFDTTKIHAEAAALLALK